MDSKKLKLDSLPRTFNFQSTDNLRQVSVQPRSNRMMSVVRILTSHDKTLLETKFFNLILKTNQNSTCLANSFEVKAIEYQLCGQDKHHTVYSVIQPSEYALELSVHGHKKNINMKNS